jgi:hypothetical protein
MYGRRRTKCKTMLIQSLYVKKKKDFSFKRKIKSIDGICGIIRLGLVALFLFSFGLGLFFTLSVGPFFFFFSLIVPLSLLRLPTL